VYALDATGRGYDCELFRVAVDVPTESHDALINGDTNVLAAESWIKLKLINDILRSWESAMAGLLNGTRLNRTALSAALSGRPR
jgi:hypothetical protein